MRYVAEPSSDEIILMQKIKTWIIFNAKISRFMVFDIFGNGTPKLKLEHLSSD